MLHPDETALQKLRYHAQMVLLHRETTLRNIRNHAQMTVHPRYSVQPQLI